MKRYELEKNEFYEFFGPTLDPDSLAEIMKLHDDCLKYQKCKTIVVKQDPSQLKHKKQVSD